MARLIINGSQIIDDYELKTITDADIRGGTYSGRTDAGGAITLDSDKAQAVDLTQTFYSKAIAFFEGVLNFFSGLGGGLASFGSFVKNYWKMLIIAAVALMIIDRR